MGDTSGQESPKDGASTSAPMIKKRFHNGWTNELEDMMADWADKSACYRWMHEKTSILFGGRDRYFNIPVIILSGVTAGANFALNSIVGDDKELGKWAQLGLGGASLFAGIIQTLMNFYNYAKGSEAHRVAGISWGKFNRLLVIEMRLHPDERMDSFNFLKMFRIELDRLIEQSPVIPESIINDFNRLFKNVDIVKPEITGILQHAKVYKDTGARLKRIAAEATIALHYKRGVIKQMVTDDLEGRTRAAAIEAAREVAEKMIHKQRGIIAAAITAEQSAKAAMAASSAAAAKPSPVVPKPTGTRAFVERQKQERQKELTTIATQKAGNVAELRARFKTQPSEVVVPEILPGAVDAAIRRASIVLDNSVSVQPVQLVQSDHAATIDTAITIQDIVPIASQNTVEQITDVGTDELIHDSATGYHTPMIDDSEVNIEGGDADAGYGPGEGDEKETGGNSTQQQPVTQLEQQDDENGEENDETNETNETNETQEQPKKSGWLW